MGTNTHLSEYVKVKAIINQRGEWDVPKITTLVPTSCLNDINSTPLPLSNSNFRDIVDIPSWGLKGNGKFSIGSCYLYILKDKNVININDPNWSWLWKLKLPGRIIHFLWLLKLDRILHNQMCVRRGFSQNPFCKSCGMVESANHIFRSCQRAIKVWNAVLGIDNYDPGDTNFYIWIDANLTSNESKRNMPWRTLFGSIIWNIWKMRNDFQFNDKFLNEYSVARFSINFAQVISVAFCGPGITCNSNDERLISWSFPLAGCIKINTDGSCSPEDHRGGFGGLVRTDQGKWVEGFCGYIGYADALKAELWGIRHALKLCKDRNWRNITIESDCLVAVKLVNDNDDEENHPNRILIDDCKYLVAETVSSLVHILREANRCADVLACMGREQTELEVRMLIPPNEVVEEMACDMRGIAYGRGT
ncbi:hypothetical protein LguiA_031271 [Lonicera macranthoides]